MEEGNEQIRDRVFTHIPSEHLQAAVTIVDELTRPPDDNYAQELVGRYVLMRRFLPTLLRILDFESTPNGQSTLLAVQFLSRLEGRSIPSFQDAPRDVITRP